MQRRDLLTAGLLLPATRAWSQGAWPARPVRIVVGLIAHRMVVGEASCISAYIAPVPRNTAGIVLSRIFKSNASDHWSMYSKSCRIQ